jgi:preprotein translocase subunit SecG
MFLLICVITIIVAILLTLIVLIQNPKGGGLSSSFGGVGTQILGASRTTDVVERLTWYLAAGIMLLCLVSVVFLPSGTKSSAEQSAKSEVEESIKKNGTPTSALPAPAMTMPAPAATPAPAPAPAQSEPAKK